MLVVTRRPGEAIVIGDPKNPIGTIHVTAVAGDRVRIALDFPRDIPINRQELADAISKAAQPQEHARP